MPAEGVPTSGRAWEGTGTARLTSTPGATGHGRGRTCRRTAALATVLVGAVGTGAWSGTGPLGERAGVPGVDRAVPVQQCWGVLVAGEHRGGDGQVQVRQPAVVGGQRAGIRQPSVGQHRGDDVGERIGAAGVDAALVVGRTLGGDRIEAGVDTQPVLSRQVDPQPGHPVRCRLERHARLLDLLLVPLLRLALTLRSDGEFSPVRHCCGRLGLRAASSSRKAQLE